MTSLAVANRPDAIHFVLVDYKGASAFADCANLPHTVGLVTNLDGRETQRRLPPWTPSCAGVRPACTSYGRWT